MLSRLRSFFLGLFKRSGLEDNMSDEIRFHLQLRTEDLIRSGLSEEEARRRARIEFGGIESYKEGCRESLGLRVLDELAGDLKYTIRNLRKSPSFAIVAVMTLALGIGANAGLFTAIDTFVFRPIPVRDPWSLFQVEGRSESDILAEFSYREYSSLREMSEPFQDLIADCETGGNTTTGVMAGYLVSGNYFTALGIRTCLGRPIIPDDEASSSYPVLVISYSAWQRRFGADPGVVGSQIELASRSFTIIGVADPDFTSIDLVTGAFWAPLSCRAILDGMRHAPFDNPSDQWLRVIGRLKPGLTQEQGQAAVAGVLPQITSTRPKESRLLGAALYCRATITQWNRSQWLLALPVFVAFGLVLLVVCSNLAGVQLARSMGRQREIGIRLALGAGRARIVRQLVTECLALALAGGSLGLVLSEWTLVAITSLVNSIRSHVAMPLIEIRLDFRILLFVLLLSIIGGVTFGLVPAVQATRPGLSLALKAEGAIIGARTGQKRLRDILVIAQCATSLVLLCMAGVLVRNMMTLASLCPGFDTAHTISLSLVSRSDALPPGLTERIAAIPGVLSAATAFRSPFDGPGLPRPFSALTGDGESAKLTGGFNPVSAEYFETLGIPLVRGRAFTRLEVDSEAPVAIVSQATAERLWPGEDPLNQQIWIVPAGSGAGKVLRLSDFRAIDIIGLAGNVIGRLPPQPNLYSFYLPGNPARSVGGSLFARVAGNPDAVMPAISSELRSAYPTAVFDQYTIKQLTTRELLQPRLYSGVFAGLGLLALLLASVGVYGVLAYLVGQRAREIGIRMALGAERRTVLWLIMRHGCKLISLSVALGLILAVAFSRVLGATVFGVKTMEPLVYVLSAIVLAIIGLLATLAPARRATLVDPSVALRYE
jgi:predicted permease